MALVDARPCARAFRVVVVVLIASALVGIPQHTKVSGRFSVQALVLTAVEPESREAQEVSEDVVRSTDDFDVHPTVRSVALKGVVARGENLESLEEENSDEIEENGSWSRDVVEVAEQRTIGKRMMVPRGRSLRTTSRPPFPCTLPQGTCRPTETCCGSACVTVSSNPSHCGRCGHMCSVKRECCNGKCRRLATDEKNCGRCGSRCAPGTKCMFGLCGYSS